MKDYCVLVWKREKKERKARHACMIAEATFLFLFFSFIGHNKDETEGWPCDQGKERVWTSALRACLEALMLVHFLFLFDHRKPSFGLISFILFKNERRKQIKMSALSGSGLSFIIFLWSAHCWHHLFSFHF